MRATRMYLTQLCTKKVLIRADGCYRAGPNAEAYKAERPKTKAGGTSRRYKAQRRVTDELAAKDWEAKRQGLTSGGEQPGHDGGMPTEATETDDALRLDVVAERLSVSRWTLKRWIKSGKLKGYRLPNGEYRASKAAVDAIFQQEVADG